MEKLKNEGPRRKEKKFPEKIYLTFGGEQKTYTELEKEEEMMAEYEPSLFCRDTSLKNRKGPILPQVIRKRRRKLKEKCTENEQLNSDKNI